MEDVRTLSQTCTQVTDLQENVRGIMHIKISPQQSIQRVRRMMACWPVESWTSDVIVSERSMISKIRARHRMRNRLLYTAHAVGSRGSQRREQEVGRQKPSHTTRVDPLRNNKQLGVGARTDR